MDIAKFRIGKEENLFRAWIEKTKEMRVIHSFENETNILRSAVLNYWDHPDEETAKIKGYVSKVFQKECILMQYTPFKDTKKEKLCEGDITKNKYGVKHVIGKRDGAFCLLSLSGELAVWFCMNGGQKFVDENEIKKIGTVFENSDLLK